MRTAALLAGLLLLGAVACASVPPPYQPTASMSAEEAKFVIRRALEEQPPGWGVSDIEVSDEKLSFIRDVGRYIGPFPTTSYTEPTRFYFESFGSAEISRKKRKEFKGAKKSLKQFMAETSQAEAKKQESSGA